MIGKLIGNYQITAELAQGRLGPIYRGQTVDQAREVVIKTVNLAAFPASTQVQLKARFRREIFVQRQLQHPNIVRVYDFLNLEDGHYVVTEFVQASSLRELLNRQGLPTVQQAVYLVKQALAALDYAHSFSYQDQSDFHRTGIAHGDIKPSNLLLDPRGRLRLTDFGIANKVLSGKERTTATLQESDYLAPEQLRGVTPDAASDIYSLGVTFYEMLTGRVPFTNWSRSGALDPRRLTGEAEAQSLTEIRPDVPPTLALTVARAIRRNPKERFASAADFLRAILSCEPQINTSELTSRIHALKSATQSSQPPLPLSPTQAPASPARRTTVPFPKSPPEVQILPPEQAVPEQTALDRLPRVDLAKHDAAVYASQQTSALPRTVPIMVEPPEFPGVRKSRREWWLVPSALAAMFVGALAGAYFFSSPSTNEGRASDIALKQAVASPAPGDTITPTPVATDDLAQHATPRSLFNLPTPKTATVPASPLLNQARIAEQQERYTEAIKAYEDFVQANSATPFAAVARARVTNLRLFVNLLTNARAALTEAHYDEARQKFGEALKLRPASPSAQSGLREAIAKLPAAAPAAVVAPAASTREGNRPPEVEQEKENKNELRDAPGTKSETTPDKQPRSEESSARPRTTPKPTPTPDSH